MKTKLLACFAGLLTAFLALSPARAVEVIVPDSIVGLANSGTKYYTFHDSASGESVIVKVVMTPYCPPTADRFTVRGAGTRVAIGPVEPPPTADGDSIDQIEGVDFTATLMFASTGVDPTSVTFQIGSLGMRGSGPNVAWSSPVGPPLVLAIGLERPYILDPLGTPIGGGVTYTAQLRHSTGSAGTYQLSDAGVLIAGDGIVMHVRFNTIPASPYADSWITDSAARYARIYRNNADMLNSISVITWTNPPTPGKILAQWLPAYAGVQEIHSTADDVYIRTTGLGGHVMGPWVNGTFPNVPINQKSLWRFPRAPVVPVAKTYTPASTIGYLVDGVAIFDPWSGVFYTPAGLMGGAAPGGYWNENAYESEKIYFDPGLGHPEGHGIQHNHVNPLATRHRLGDHVDFDATTKAYTESTNPVTRHSPILGWMKDGFPLYGPYGYSNGMDSASTIRRMTNGYVLRDGTVPGVDNITPPPVGAGRSTRPDWAQRLFTPCMGPLPCLPAGSDIGPDVDPTYFLGYFMEDYAYLGDLINPVTGANYVKGVDFDLDEFNGRWCVTPEFPMGTYAYFLAIHDTGAPAYPYIIGRAFYGDPVGGATNTLPATVTTHFLGEIHRPVVMNTPTVNAGSVTLTWSAAEGGHYKVESTTDLTTWTTLTTNAGTTLDVGSYTKPASEAVELFRVAPWTFDWFDPVLDIVAPDGGIAYRGTYATVTITIQAPPTPPLLPEVPALISLDGTVYGLGVPTRPSEFEIVTTFAIPPTMSTGAKDIYVEFLTGDAYLLSGALTIK